MEVVKGRDSPVDWTLALAAQDLGPLEKLDAKR